MLSDHIREHCSPARTVRPNEWASYGGHLMVEDSHTRCFGWSAGVRAIEIARLLASYEEVHFMQTSDGQHPTGILPASQQHLKLISYTSENQPTAANSVLHLNPLFIRLEREC